MIDGSLDDEYRSLKLQDQGTHPNTQTVPWMYMFPRLHTVISPYDFLQEKYPCYIGPGRYLEVVTNLLWQRNAYVFMHAMLAVSKRSQSFLGKLLTFRGFYYLS
jgi:hypothetical protein